MVLGWIGVLANILMAFWYVFEYWKLLMDPEGAGAKYWQNTFLAMSGVSFVSCIFYGDSLRRIRKTIRD
jgi:hypothetical protein